MRIDVPADSRARTRAQVVPRGRDASRARRDRRDAARAATARLGGRRHVYRDAMQFARDDARRSQLGAFDRSLPATLQVQLRRGPAGLPRRPRDRHGAVRRLGVAGRSGHRVHDVQANASLTRDAGHRGELVAVRADGSESEFGGEHGDFRVHAIAGEFAQFQTWLRCAAASCGVAAGDSAHAYVKGVLLRTEDRAVARARRRWRPLLFDGSSEARARSTLARSTEAGGSASCRRR